MDQLRDILITLLIVSLLFALFYLMWSNPAGELKTVDSTTKTQTITTDSTVTTIIFKSDTTFVIQTPRRKSNE